MALVVKDRVQETTTTTGTGTITLAGAVTGFQSFSVIGNSNTTYYVIAAGSEFEVGIGTYTSLYTTLSRTTVLESSNAGSLVNFSAGVKNVFCTYPAEKAIYADASDVVNPPAAILGASNTGSVIPFYFANQAAFPSASTYHGALAHSHSDGAMYFAHGGSWIRITNDGGPLGTPSSGTATNLTGLPLTTGVTGTLPVTNGGIGVATLTTAYGVLAAGTTATGAVQNIGTGTTAQVLTSNGSGVLPTFQTLSSGITITDDTTTATDLFPTFTNATSGTISAAKVTSTKLTFVPSTGSLNAPQVAASNGIFVNNMTVGSNYTIPSGYGAHSVGAVTISSGVVVTVPSGSRWVVL